MWITLVLCFSALATVARQQTLQTNCACVGGDPSVDALAPDCSSSGGTVLISSVYRASKLTSLSCPASATNGNRDVPNCCTFSVADSCMNNVSYTDVPSLYTDCTGQATCTHVVTSQPLTGCAAAFMTNTNFMCVEYFCISDTDVTTFCDTTSTHLWGTPLYFKNDYYPSAISQTSCCTCAVTASAASATIDINLLDARLWDASTTCQQSLIIQDGATLYQHNCTINNDFVITKLMTSATNSLLVTLKADSASGGNGQMYLEASVSSGGISVECGAVAVCPDLVTTTTSGSAASSDDEEWLWGQTIAVSSAFIAGLFVILLLGIILACYCCFHYGKEKSINLDHKSSNSVKPIEQTDNMEPRHEPARPMYRHKREGTYYESRDHYRHPDDPIFVSRPYDNKHDVMKYEFSKRQRFPRVET